MTCPDCAHTEANAGHWPCYRSGCTGCAARGIARSLAAWKAIRKQDSEELREMIVRIFPKMPYGEARELVWKAWQLDHRHEESVTS